MKRHKNAIYRQDYRNGILCALVANLFREKGKAPLEPEDFIPTAKETIPQEQGDQEIINTVYQLHARFGGKVEGGLSKCQ